MRIKGARSREKISSQNTVKQSTSHGEKVFAGQIYLFLTVSIKMLTLLFFCHLSFGIFSLPDIELQLFIFYRFIFCRSKCLRYPADRAAKTKHNPIFFTQHGIVIIKTLTILPATPMESSISVQLKTDSYMTSSKKN